MPVALQLQHGSAERRKRHRAPACDPSPRKTLKLCLSAQGRNSLLGLLLVLLLPSLS